MERLLLGCSVFVFMVSANSVRAQGVLVPVKIILKENLKKPVRGIIVKESVKGIELSSKSKTYAANEIHDIDYSDLLQIRVSITYRSAVLEEKAANAAKTLKERDHKLKSAIAKYGEVLSKMNSKLQFARRHAQFKIAYLHGQLALKGGGAAAVKTATAELSKFKTEHKDSWQFTPALMSLAILQAKQKDYKALLATGKELTAAVASAKAKRESQLAISELLMGGQQYKEAQKILQSLVTEIPKDDPLSMKARLAEASCVALSSPDIKLAVAKLKAILKEAKDKNARALAYNTLGECYYRKDLLQEARWQFLWVDVIYNQDGSEHAKALYYLWRIFSRLNEFDRAQEAYNSLMNDARFNGSFFRQRAIDEAKKLAG